MENLTPNPSPCTRRKDANNCNPSPIPSPISERGEVDYSDSAFWPRSKMTTVAPAMAGTPQSKSHGVR